MRKLTWLLLLLLPLLAQAQWPLHQMGYSGYQWSGNTQNLLSKVRYSHAGARLAVYNLAYPYNITPSIHGVTWDDYPFMDNLAMMVMRDTTLPNGGYDQNIFLSGSSSNYARDVATDDQDRLLVLGDNLGDSWDENWSQPTPWTTTSQVLLLKLDRAQHVLWHRTYGGSANEHAVAIQPAPDGNFLILATAASTDGDVAQGFGGTDIWLLKVDGANGNLLWQKSFGGPGNDLPADLEVLADGSILIAGSAPASAPYLTSAAAGANAFVLRLNASGDVQRSYVSGGSGTDAVVALAPLGTDGFAALLESNSTDGPFAGNRGARDIYITRLTSDLAPVWSQHYGNAQDDEAGDIVFTPCDSMLFASYAKQYSYDFPGPGNFPEWTQRAGVCIALRANGTQTFYREDNFNYPFSHGPFNEGIWSSMAPNDRGGFLGGNLKHDNWDGGYPADKARSFDLVEFGTALRRARTDTSICSGQPVYGVVYTRDSVLADTLRNACGVDTLIRALSIHVTSTADSLVRRPDTTLCPGALYNGNPVSASFIHSDSTQLATPCGPRWVIRQQAVTVGAALPIDLGPDTTLCSGGSLTMPAGGTGLQYLWSTGSTTSVLTIHSPGLYWVEAQDAAGCRRRDSVRVTASDLYLLAPRDTTLVAGSSVLLAPASNGSLSWDPSPALSCSACPAALATPPATAWFYCTALRSGCTLRDSVQVTVKDGVFIWVPTAFTPNGDGHNDQLRVHASGVPAFELVVYNRWGQPVFATTHTTLGWDGSFRGRPQDGGTFAWILRYTDAAGRSQLQKGTLQLIR
ncbi:gliding motility-associated C-terminal domain-containing protein [Flaviaesturariibacter aridisoli]|nr:gliding motility-associated C-terminal domain-containing protein [Flaviaesturariibacter aridisoli]